MSTEAVSAARAAILEGQRAAAEQYRIIAAQVPLREEFFRKHLRCYILCKFLLTLEEAPEEENLAALARQSLAKTMKLSREMVALYDTSAGCSSASSVDSKLVLLILAVQREFRLELPLEKAVRVQTVGELAALVWQAMEKTPEWAGHLG